MSFLAVTEPAAAGSTVWAVLGTKWGILGCWLLVINLATFLVFGIDKGLAKWKVNHEATRRVPEKALFLLAALGGSIGALLGMQVWRHKTLHKSFCIGIPLILFLQVIIPLGLYIYFHFVR